VTAYDAYIHTIRLAQRQRNRFTGALSDTWRLCIEWPRTEAQVEFENALHEKSVLAVAGTGTGTDAGRDWGRGLLGVGG
jgi:hypothetical protein